MKERLIHLAARRRELLEKIQVQRIELAEISLHLKNPLAIAETGLNAVRFINEHSALMAGTLAALLTLRRKGISGLLRKGWRLLYILPLSLLRR